MNPTFILLINCLPAIGISLSMQLLGEYPRLAVAIATVNVTYMAVACPTMILSLLS